MCDKPCPANRPSAICKAVILTSARIFRYVSYESGIIHIVCGSGGPETLIHCCMEGSESTLPASPSHMISKQIYIERRNKRPASRKQS
jgi:hypothetical protein